MGKRKQYAIGNEVFDSQGALIKRIQDILYGVDVNEALGNTDFQFMRALLHNHPHAKKKIGKGIASIKVLVEPKWKTRCFYAFRVDGTFTDFSYRECIRAETQFEKFSRACRTVVEDQILAFKQNFFSDIEHAHCSITGQPIDFLSSHVDHEMPNTFLKLVMDFIELNNVNIDTITFRSQDALIGPKISTRDADTYRLFAKYHKEHAKMRVISREANLTAKRITYKQMTKAA
jgi:hypothetical protein